MCRRHVFSRKREGGTAREAWDVLSGESARRSAADRTAFQVLIPENLCFQRWHAPRNFGTFCPEVRLLAVLPQPGYPFSDGHSVFKVLSIDELP